MMHPRLVTRLVITLAGIHLIGGAWLMGGYFSAAPWLMGITGWLAGIIAIFHAVQALGPPRTKHQAPRTLILSLCWGLLIALLFASLLNPAYREIVSDTGKQFLFKLHPKWLPSVVSVERSLPMIFQMTGSLALAWSLFTVVESRRRLRSLLLASTVNAFALGLAGGILKLIGAENPLYFFKSVNPSFFASFTYHNHWVAFATLNLCFATGLLAHAVRHRQNDRSDSNRFAALGAMAFFLLLSLLLVESRAGLLIAIIYTLGGSLYLISRKLDRLKAMPKYVGIAVTLLIGVGYVSLQISEKQLGNVSEKYEKTWYTFWDADAEIDDFRFNSGPKIAGDLIKEKPLLGWGFGSYFYAMKVYAPDYLEEDVGAQFAHNDWMQFFAELGGIGFFLFAFPLAYAIYKYRRPNVTANWIRFGLGMVLFMALWEFPLSNPTVLAHFVVGFIVSVKLKTD